MSPHILDEEEFEEARPTRRTVRRLASFIGPYRGLYLLAVALEVVYVAPGLGQVHLIKLGIERFLSGGRIGGTILIGGLLAGAFALQSVVAMVQMRLLWRSGQRALNDIRRAVFRHVQALSLGYFDRTRQGRIIARADRDVDTLEPFVVWSPSWFLNCLLNLGGAIGLLLYYDWRLCVALLSVVPPFTVATIIFRRRGIRAYRRIRRSVARVTSDLAENISGVQEVQAFTREPLNLRRFRQVNLDLYGNVMRAAWVWNAYWPVVSLLSGAARVLILVYGGYLAATGRLGSAAAAVGILFASNQLVSRFFEPLMGLSELYNEVLGSSAAAERIFAFLDTEPEVRDGPGAVPAETIVGAVDLRGVCFAYDAPPIAAGHGQAQPTAPEAAAGNGWVLHDVNILAEPGDTIALVGPTGAGKSTVVNLIARFYEPQRGQVLVDGHSINAFTLESLHRQMGIVLQENFLFTGTVMENIKFGRPEVSDEAAVEAAKALGAHPFIERLASRYQTPVKERGAGLSQGERQLICFTRALVANPRILILDEATSAVDTYTETILQRALRQLMRGRTTFVVAHRLSTIRHATRVYVLDGGRVVEEGTHDELVAAGGPYQRMHEQFVRA